jgi:hypothetical protein
MATIIGSAGGSGEVTGVTVKTPDTGIFGTTVTQDANGLNIHAIFVYDNGNVFQFNQALTPTQQARLVVLIESFVNPARLTNGTAGPIVPQDIAAVVCSLAYAQESTLAPPTVPVTLIVRGYDIPVILPTH